MLRSIQRQHHVIAVTNPRAHVRAGHHGSGDGAAAIHRAWVHQRGGHTEPPSGKGGEAWAAFAREEGGGVLAVELVSVGGLSGSAQELGGVLAVQGVGVGVDRALGADLALKSPLALDALLALCSGWPLLPGGAGLALSCSEASPSTMSALRLATFVSELTVLGASPGCTAKERAVSSVPVLGFSTCMAAPLTLPVSLVKALATFALPRRKGELPPRRGAKGRCGNPKHQRHHQRQPEHHGGRPSHPRHVCSYGP